LNYRNSARPSVRIKWFFFHSMPLGCISQNDTLILVESGLTREKWSFVRSVSAATHALRTWTFIMPKPPNWLIPLGKCIAIGVEFDKYVVCFPLLNAVFVYLLKRTWCMRISFQENNPMLPTRNIFTIFLIFRTWNKMQWVQLRCYCCFIYCTCNFPYLVFGDNLLLLEFSEWGDRYCGVAAQVTVAVSHRAIARFDIYKRLFS